MSIVRKQANGKLYCEFDGVADVFRAIDRLNWVPQRDRASDESGGGYGSDFYTFNSLAEARDVFQNKPESIRTFSINDDRLERPDSPGKDVLFDVTGDFLDIDRHIMDEPEQFGNAVMGNPKNIFCTINVLASYVYYTDNKYLIQRQKRILRIVDWLEQQGVRCQIVATTDDSIAHISTVVKQFQDPFNLNELAVTAHPDWLRRIQFLILEQSATWRSGYGSSIEYDLRMTKYSPEPEDGVYIYVGGFIPYSTVRELDEAFDELEQKIIKLVDDGMTWNDEPFTIGSGKGW